MAAITLHCSHPLLRDELTAWLLGARLPPSAVAELFVDVGELPPVSAEAGAVFRQGRVAIRGGTTARPVIELEWGPGLGKAVVDPDGAIARVIIAPKGLEQGHELCRSFMLNVCILVLRRAGLHHIHGAALIDPTFRGWLLVGESGSGKSTTTALLAKLGWSVGTDDIAFLTRGSKESSNEETVEVLAWRDHVALRPDAVSTLRVTDGFSFGERDKSGWLPEALGTSWAQRVVPSVLAFTTINAQQPTSMTPLTTPDAVRRLLHNSAWVMLDASVAGAHLELLASLAKQVRPYALSLGRDMFEHPERLIELAA